MHQSRARGQKCIFDEAKTYRVAFAILNTGPLGLYEPGSLYKVLCAKQLISPAFYFRRSLYQQLFQNLKHSRRGKPFYHLLAASRLMALCLVQLVRHNRHITTCSTSLVPRSDSLRLPVNKMVMCLVSPLLHSCCKYSYFSRYTQSAQRVSVRPQVLLSYLHTL